MKLTDKILSNYELYPISKTLINDIKSMNVNLEHELKMYVKLESERLQTRFAVQDKKVMVTWEEDGVAKYITSDDFCTGTMTVEELEELLFIGAI